MTRPDDMPPDTAPPLAWALWYREQGFWPLPIRDQRDRDEWAEAIASKLIADGAGEEEARAAALTRVERGRKHTFVGWRKWREAPTGQQIRRWWAERPERGIALLTGPGRGLAVIDVDTAKGGDPSPWIEACPCVAVTPSGGCHLVYLAAEIRSTTTEIAPGVDTRGIGGLIAAPSGSASPGRRWLRWDGLSELPEDVATRVHPASPRAVGGASAAQVGPEDLDGLIVQPTREDRTFAAALAQPALDGERHRKAAAILGLLARTRPLPRDAVEVALALLSAWAERRALAVDVFRSIERAWRGALESDRRDASFAFEVLRVWNDTRCSPPWPADKVQETALGIWSTASGREDARIAADETEELDVESETAKLDLLLPTRAATYTRAHFAADRRRGLLSISHLPHWADWTGKIDHSLETGHGWGTVLNEGLGGGLAPGYFCVLGAGQAKGGKTAFVEYMLAGIALRSVAVLAGEASGPVVIPYYIGEMWQGGEESIPSSRQIAHRDLARWLGVDGSLFRRGDDSGGDAPGVRRMAEELGRDPTELALEILNTADATLASDGLFRRAQALMPLMNTRLLMSAHDAQGEDLKGPRVDHRRGVPLLRALTVAIRADRARKAKAWGRQEHEIWPLIFIDPIQRYQGGGDNAVGALDEFVEELRAMTDELQAIVIATSDTNKESAKGGMPKDLSPFARAAHVFRGSYKLLHLPDSALVLETTWPTVPTAYPTTRVWVALNRWGPPLFEPAYFEFRAESGRYHPLAGPPVEPDLDIVEEDEEPEVKQPRARGGKFGRKS